MLPLKRPRISLNSYSIIKTFYNISYSFELVSNKMFPKKSKKETQKNNKKKYLSFPLRGQKRRRDLRQKEEQSRNPR
jgi:hypothetical protein